MTRGSTTQRHSGNSGFTLMELLIATMVAAIVLAAINTAFYAAMRLRSSTTAVVEKTIPMNRSVSALKADLRNVLVTGGKIAGSFGSPGTLPGNNQATLLDIYTTTGLLQSDLPWGDLQRISYYLKNSSVGPRGSGRDLVRAISRNLLATLQPDVTEQVLLSGVNSVDFTFYDGANWQTSWDSTNSVAAMPRAVKVEIQFANNKSGGDILLPIEMVVPLDSQAATNIVTITGTSGGTGG